MFLKACNVRSGTKCFLDVAMKEEEQEERSGTSMVSSTVLMLRKTNLGTL